jgi:cytochrome c-type biogenesis protein CcmH/NrfG
MQDEALIERIEGLRELVAEDPDDVTTRFMLGTELAKAKEHAEAAEQFRAVIERDPDYTAAWRGLGRALVALDDVAGARDVFTRGLEVAARTGDYQSGREMEVFLRRYTGEGG